MMKNTSKVILGATLILVLSFALVLSLILVLLAELYCSLLTRRRRRSGHNTNQHENITATTVDEEAPSQLQIEYETSSVTSSSLSQFYSHGVLNNAPRSFLFPSLCSKHEQHQFHLGASNSPEPEAAHSTSNHEVMKEQDAEQLHSVIVNESSRSSTSKLEHPQNLVYISNPIFDEEGEDYKMNGSTATSPYATPDTSPTRLGNNSDSSDEEDHEDM